jgi:hypothetical protein
MASIKEIYGKTGPKTGQIIKGKDMTPYSEGFNRNGSKKFDTNAYPKDRISKAAGGAIGSGLAAGIGGYNPGKRYGFVTKTTPAF